MMGKEAGLNRVGQTNPPNLLRRFKINLRLIS